jgi:hypothetical protein
LRCLLTIWPPLHCPTFAFSGNAAQSSTFAGLAPTTRRSCPNSQTGTLDPGESTTANIFASFCRLGRNAIPVVCHSTGVWSRFIVIANVCPPQISLVTERINFSDDFVICNRSHA